MEKLKAFVGHSFDENDKEVIDRFLNFFNSLKDTTELEWDHAETPEVKAVSKKVREKMERKDLFIGIFTKKDYRVRPDKLKKHRFSKNGHISETDCVWATSDWIIQESGYALAKDLQLLFLVESGVDLPGGLQGDLEFISFNRENPDSCFTEFNHMIGSVLRNKKKEAVLGEKKAFPQDVQHLEEGEKQEDKQVPKEPPRSKYFQSFNALWDLTVTKKDFDGAEKELDNVLERHKDHEDTDEIYWRSTFYWMKCIAGNDKGFAELKELSERNPDHPLPLTHLGGAYKGYGNFSEAARQYLEASKRKKEKAEQIESIGTAAECYALDKNFKEAYAILLKEFGDGELDSTQYHKLYTKLTKIAQMDKNDNLFTAFAEKALEYSPADADTRFSLAHRYAEIDNDSTALHHYKILCDRNPNGGSLNNMGVAYGQLGMKYKSVCSFRKAADEYKHTLSMANLAYNYIEQGFLSDASDILEKARTEKDYHDNVDTAMTRIHRTKETEEKSEKDVLENLERERKFRVKFAEAYALPSEVDIDCEWESEHGKILLKVEGKRISGNYEISPPDTQAVTSRAGLLSNTLAGLGLMPRSFRKKIIKLEGKIYNRGIEYQLTITIAYPPNTPLSTSKTTYEGVMCVAKDQSIIEVMERVKDEKEVGFYDMKRIQDSSNA